MTKPILQNNARYTTLNRTHGEPVTTGMSTYPLVCYTYNPFQSSKKLLYSRGSNRLTKHSSKNTLISISRRTTPVHNISIQMLTSDCTPVSYTHLTLPTNR